LNGDVSEDDVSDNYLPDDELPVFAEEDAEKEDEDDEDEDDEDEDDEDEDDEDEDDEDEDDENHDGEEEEKDDKGKERDEVMEEDTDIDMADGASNLHDLTGDASSPPKQISLKGIPGFDEVVDKDTSAMSNKNTARKVITLCDSDVDNDIRPVTRYIKREVYTPQCGYLEINSSVRGLLIKLSYI
jgi:hypothetical protein